MEIPERRSSTGPRAGGVSDSVGVANTTREKAPGGCSFPATRTIEDGGGWEGEMPLIGDC